jgi:hypothetical protein
VAAEITELGRTEIASVTAWATGGCIGHAPRADQNKRIMLGQKLTAAQSAAAAAKGAGADIDRQISALNDQLRTIAAQIEKAALDGMHDEFRALSDQHLAAIEAARKLSAKLLGLCSYLSNEGRRRLDRGDQEGGKAYLARAEALTSIKLANPGNTQGEIIEAANDWARRAAALNKGSA